MSQTTRFVIPAKAGIQYFSQQVLITRHWIPAFAGMTFQKMRVIRELYKG